MERTEYLGYEGFGDRVLRRAGLLPLPRRRLPLRAGCLEAAPAALTAAAIAALLGDIILKNR